MSSHYRVGGMEAMDVIEKFDLNFALGNAIKYILRAGKKTGENKDRDLEKAMDYLHREVYGDWREKDEEESKPYFYIEDSLVKKTWFNGTYKDYDNFKECNMYDTYEDALKTLSERT